MPDERFSNPRLAAIYDALEPDREDLVAYMRIVQDFAARSVLDIGCGTGVLALALADRGVAVIGVDPAQASIDVARAKPGSERVRWICGTATDLPPLQADMVTMTGNVAQAIADADRWRATLRAAHRALRPGGRLVLETRDPAFRGWLEWNRTDSYRVVEIPGAGSVQTWDDVIEVGLGLVRFRTTFVFAVDGAVLISDSTLRFRERAEVDADLQMHGFTVDEVRDAPDRPGRELVFVASRRAPS